MEIMEYKAHSVQAWPEDSVGYGYNRKPGSSSSVLVDRSKAESILTSQTKPESMQEGYLSEVLILEDVFKGLEHRAEPPSMKNVIFLLQECRKKKSLACATHVLSHISNHGLEMQSTLGNHLVPLFVECGSMSCAQQVFHRLAHRNELSWTSLIHGYVEFREWKHAFNLFQEMQEDGVQPSRYTFMVLLKCCATISNMQRGRDVHSKMIKEGHEKDTFIGNTLVDMYGKCGLLVDAQEVFNKLPSRDVVLWNTLISGYAEQRASKEVLLCLEQMQLEGMLPDAVTFVCTLKACSSIEALERGQVIHSEITKKGCESEPLVVKSLVDMYSLCRSLVNAQAIVNVLPVQDVYSWAALMAAYAEHGLSSEVLGCKEQMRLEGLSPNATVFVYSLKACGSLGAVDCGRHLHSEVEKHGFQGCPIVASALITMYAKCGSLAEARRVFDELRVRDAIAWTAMIAGFAEYGLAVEALNSLQWMQMEGVFPDAVTFVCGLKACRSIGALDRGREIHAEIVKEGFQTSSFVGNTLVDMYAKCGSLTEGRDVFDELLVRDIVSWNALIDAYVECGVHEEALTCLEQMQQEGMPLDAGTFVCSLKACCCVGAIDKGQEIHTQIAKQGLERDIFIGSTLLDMYCKCGSLAEACDVFDELPVRNVVTWSALILGYVENDHAAEALKCLEQMQLEGVCADAVTLVCNLKACGSMGAIDKGREIHSYIAKIGFHSDTFVGSSLVDFYVKSGLLADAQEVFNKLSVQDMVSWSSLISGYTDLGLAEDALHCYHQMQLEGVPPSAVTLFCTLKACGSIGAIDIGRDVHVEIAKEELESDPFVSNTLIDMYAKCGSLEEALEVFEEQLLFRDVISWSAVISGCVEQGETDKAFLLYRQMQEQGVVPNDVTFLSILKACGNMSALDTGKRVHAQIYRACEAEAMLATALLDMYAKCGSMVDAQQLFDAMPDKDVVALNALLNGYARQGESDLLLSQFERMREEHIDPNETTYLSLLTVCNHAGLVGKGQKYFDAMSREDGISPSAKHFDCMVDLLGRAGQLEKAAAMLEDIPFQPDSIAWINMLGACRRLGNVELGRQAFECAMKFDGVDSAIFILMSNIYADADFGGWDGDWG